MRVVDKPISEMSKAEIEKKLDGMGDYVKMSYLQRALKSNLDFDTRKFVLIRLSGIYEVRKMFLEAAKTFKTAAEINTTFAQKMNDFMKVADLYIKGNDYVEADRMFAQALALASDKQKKELKNNFKNFYLTQAKIYLSNDKRNYARLAFEKCLTLELDAQEKTEVQNQLLELYNKLGLVRDYYNLKESM